jgi:hypothetical protein
VEETVLRNLNIWRIIYVKHYVWFVSDEDIPETVMKDNIMVSTDIKTEEKKKSVGSST